jgi:hypothetical protein
MPSKHQYKVSDKLKDGCGEHMEYLRLHWRVVAKKYRPPYHRDENMAVVIWPYLGLQSIPGTGVEGG